MDWKLTRDLAGEPEIDEIHPDDREDLTVGFRYMGALADTGEVPYRWSDTGSGPGVMRPVLGAE